MPLFSYKALTLTGETADGLEPANSLEQLREILSSRDLILKTGRVSSGASSLGRPPLKHIANFNRELTVLLRAGISIPESLSLLSVRPGQPKLEKALQVVTAEVKRGGSLSDAMGKAPAVFDAPYRALVATGEQSGALPVCLERYQDYVDLKQKIGGQVSKAMIYPIVLLIVLSGVLTFLFVEVIPNFVSMYAELGSSLPAPTQVLIAVEENFPPYRAHHRRDAGLCLASGPALDLKTGRGHRARQGASAHSRFRPFQTRFRRGGDGPHAVDFDLVRGHGPESARCAQRHGQRERQAARHGCRSHPHRLHSGKGKRGAQRMAQCRRSPARALPARLRLDGRGSRRWPT